MPRAIFLFHSLFIYLLLFTQQAWSADGRADYDLDGDGLIEINDWADLNEIRNNLDGTSLYGSSAGCPADGCIGFELTTDLDFDTNGDEKLDSSDTYWNGGEGWEPLGTGREEKAFRAAFYGNGHLILNLMTARPEEIYQGLFGVIANADVKELGLAGPLMKIQGKGLVGGLVGYAEASEITATFVSGVVEGAVPDGGSVGGLVGWALGTPIVASFVSGRVSAQAGSRIGGLVGNRLAGDVIASLSTAYIQSNAIGGMIGYSATGDATDTIASYWATDAAGQTISYGGTGSTLRDLKCPTSADNSTCTVFTLFEGWSNHTDDQGNPYWDFGSDGELPGLRMQGRLHRDADGDGAWGDYDAFPTQFAASVDSDGDGAGDAWKLGCDLACRNDSGLVLDQFPNHVAAAVDTDLDGRPDQWNDDCDSACQASSGLVLDSDNDDDGIDNDEDAFPVNNAAAVDSDNDGFPDAWLAACDSECQAASGLTLDVSLNDSDNDGVLNDEDAFATNSAASVDADNDGFPDAWHDDCENDCQSSSGLTLDESLNDTDNDGVANEQDAFPSDAAAAVDADSDGLPDAWLDTCDGACQSASDLTLDAYLDDSDNDGVVNHEDAYPSDPARAEDQDAPEMAQVPATINVAATGESTLVSLNVDELQATDNFDSELSYQVELNGELLERDDQQQVPLPSGALSLDWFAVDDAGNRSEPLSQTVNVYPQVRFTQTESITGEQRVAPVAVSLSGPSPEYPISVMAHWVESDSDATTADVVTEGENGVNLSELLVTIESADELENAAVLIPVATDDLVETDEVLVLELAAAMAGTADTFAMLIDDTRSSHRMTITDTNVAPTVSLTASQTDATGTVFVNDAGDITLTAEVTDVNGADSHSYQWYTETLPVTPGDEASFSFDPTFMALGDYSVRIVVTDDGNPMLSSEEVVLDFTLQQAEVPDDGDDAGDDSGDDTGDGISTGGGQTPVNSGGSSSGGSSGGSVGLWLLCLLALGGLWRRRLVG